MAEDRGGGGNGRGGVMGGGEVASCKSCCYVSSRGRFNITSRVFRREKTFVSQKNKDRLR